MARVLVIEDEILLREGVSRSIVKAGYRVDDADCLNEGIRLIDAHAPDVIVSDIDLPGRSGLELIGELGRRGLHIPIIFVSGYLNAYRAQIPQHAGVRVMEKPVSIEELRDAIKQSISGSRSNIELTPFTLIDFLQLACIGKHSVRLCLQQQDEPLGTVVVADGQLWSATDHGGEGEAAFGRLAFIEAAQTRVERLEADPGPRNIIAHWEFVVMEAARHRDEGSQFANEAPSLNLGFWREDAPADAGAVAATAQEVLREVAAAPTAGRSVSDATSLAFSEAFERGVDALLGKQYELALEAFLDAAGYRPKDPKVVANITRLKEMGYDLRAADGQDDTGEHPKGRP